MHASFPLLPLSFLYVCVHQMVLVFVHSNEMIVCVCGQESAFGVILQGRLLAFETNILSGLELANLEIISTRYHAQLVLHR